MTGSPPDFDRFRLICELTSDFAYSFRINDDGSLELEWLNGRFEETTGCPPTDSRPVDKWLALIHPDDLLAARTHLDRILAGHDDTIELRVVRTDGEVRWLRNHSRPVREMDSGPVTAFVGAAQDITEHRDTLESMRAGAARLDAIIRHSPVGIVQIDNDECVTLWNPAAEQIFGWQACEVLGKPIPFIPPDKLAEAQILHDRDLRGETQLGLDLTRQRKDGTRIDISLSCAPVNAADGNVQGSLAVILDITERNRTVKALSDERRFVSLLLETSPAFFVVIDAVGKTVRMNRALLEAVGWTAEEVRGVDYVDTFVPEEERPAVAKVLGSILVNRSLPVSQNNIVSRSGRRFLVEWRGRPVLRSDGSLEFIVGLGIDITERRRAELEHARMEAQLQHAQRMESVGRLAGGVAHDFNNMLQTILGYGELALESTSPGDSVHEYLAEMQRAARSSAALTRQLLAFARQQTVAPRVLDLNVTVTGILNMLRRLIGEDIELVWLPAESLWSVCVDPSQVDQVLANLVVNARDAIEGQGAVTIRTTNATIEANGGIRHPDERPGQYVVLSVSDTGRGMDENTLARAYDPFFTTKGLGQGTGLGLAMVYGVVKQNGGFIRGSSTVGTGTTFELFLPRNPACGGEDVEEDEVRQQEVGDVVPRGLETVLVVEDESTILNLCRRQLSDLGYSALVATSPGRALALAREHQGPIDLVVTDVIMPGMNGRDLVAMLRGIRPNLKCLFMSGYTADVIAHHGVLDPEVHFLQKPFTQADLAAGVREALEG